MSTYRIKEIRYNNGHQEFYPEYTDADMINQNSGADVWNICEGCSEDGYPNKDMCLGFIAWHRKWQKPRITSVIIHNVKYKR